MREPFLSCVGLFYSLIYTCDATDACLAATGVPNQCPLIHHMSASLTPNYTRHSALAVTIVEMQDIGRFFFAISHASMQSNITESV